MTALDEAPAALPVIATLRAAGSRHLNAVMETLAGAGMRSMAAVERAMAAVERAMAAVERAVAVAGVAR
ncbi:unnamed protein product [[Actinomadura] parvosata subsp. kistnae]|uniref:Uncharacterized protein n=1 Tax=[Actinomadura] parvosata subsp. kistnae TaxID=1909395 RepID=A0A1V0AH39_9ACTN|nr:hypothetical protein [Nonomuraea sp. ATCC 55076]AQZ69505.1 hypothetical protein BKM31_55745 [Nonomuraea sp. ATCC 55076]SPL91830.1 unnamed protein product [Actinomadura parvosata subsp. kistnae]